MPDTQNVGRGLLNAGVQTFTLLSLAVGLISVAAAVALNFGISAERAATHARAIDSLVSKVESLNKSMDAVKDVLRREIVQVSEAARLDTHRLSDRIADLRSRLDRIEAALESRSLPTGRPPATTPRIP
jgi:hypothetical protein